MTNTQRPKSYESKSKNADELYTSPIAINLRNLIDGEDGNKPKYNMGELAVIIGVKYQTISQWKRGISQPNASNIVELSKAYDVSTDWLLGRTKYKTTIENDTTAICELIGLSEQSANSLANGSVVEFINSLLSYPNIERFAFSLSNYQNTRHKELQSDHAWADEFIKKMKLDFSPTVVFNHDNPLCCHKEYQSYKACTEYQNAREIDEFKFTKESSDFLRSIDNKISIAITKKSEQDTKKKKREKNNG